MPDTGTNNPTEKKFINGAIYTHKSHEEGLEQVRVQCGVLAV